MTWVGRVFLAGLAILIVGFSPIAAQEPHVMASSWEESGDGAVEDGRYNWAMQVYNSACDLNSPTACMKAGDLLRDQLFVDDIGLYENDAFFYDLGCELGLIESCKRNQELYAFLDLRCKGGENDICVVSGMGHLQGFGTGTINPAAARTAFTSACNADVPDGCYRLGLFHYTGQEGAPDFSQAEQYLRKACDLNLGIGCAELGLIYQDGVLGSPDFDAAIDMYHLACTRGDSETCLMMGDATALSTDQEGYAETAIYYYQLGCGGGNIASCRALAYALFEGTLGEQDIARARAIAAPLCDEGEAQLCKDLGILEP